MDLGVSETDALRHSVPTQQGKSEV
jgi:hypothetical protein